MIHKVNYEILRWNFEIWDSKKLGDSFDVITFKVLF